MGQTYEKNLEVKISINDDGKLSVGVYEPESGEYKGWDGKDFGMENGRTDMDEAASRLFEQVGEEIRSWYDILLEQRESDLSIQIGVDKGGYIRSIQDILEENLVGLSDDGQKKLKKTIDEGYYNARKACFILESCDFAAGGNFHKVPVDKALKIADLLDDAVECMKTVMADKDEDFAREVNYRNVDSVIRGMVRDIRTETGFIKENKERPTLDMMREGTECGTIRLVPDEPLLIVYTENGINACWELWFDVDEVFGTNTRDTDSTVEFYTNYYPETGTLTATVVVHDNNPESEYEEPYEMTDAEKDFLLGLMEKEAKRQGYISLNDMWEKENDDVFLHADDRDF